MNTVNVNGPIYQRIIQDKDIIADVLPPPEYIIESYLVALQLTLSTQPTETIDLFPRFQTLKSECESRNIYWSSQFLTPELQASLIEKSYFSSNSFYDQASQQCLPAIQAGDHNKSQVSLKKSVLLMKSIVMR